MKTITGRTFGTNPTDITEDGRIKILVYGKAGVGKTTFAVQFPQTFFIDVEGRARKRQYLSSLEKQKSTYHYVNNFDDVIDSINWLMTTKHHYKTVAIDSLSLIYDDLVDLAERKVGSGYGAHYKEAKKQMKTLLSLLLRIDMNVIVTCHIKDKLNFDLKFIETTYDCYDKVEYLLDLALEVHIRGKNRIAIVKKSSIDSIEIGENLEFSYDEIVKRAGRSIEAVSTPVELATTEQIQELNELIVALDYPRDKIEKWFNRAKVETFNDMTTTTIQSCINFLQQYIKGAA